MFKKIKNQIDKLNQQRSYLDADWDMVESKSLLKFYVNITPKLLDAERCSIFIHDHINDEVWLKCGTGLSERQILVSTEDSIVGEVITTGECRIVTDLANREGAHKRVDKEIGRVSRNVLCVPIKTLDGKEVAGVIQVLNKLDGAEFSESDLELVEKMVHFLELTIENYYFNQEVTGTLSKIFNLLLIVTTIAATVILFLIITAVIYWFVDFLIV